MNVYYDVTTKIKNYLLADGEIHTVQKGDFLTIDLDKKNIYPLAHMNVYSAGFNPGSIELDINLLVMELRDVRKEVVTDKFVGNDNEDDNLNAMLYVLYRLYLTLQQRRIDDNWELVSFSRPEPFTESRNNIADGWTCQITIAITEAVVTAC